MKYVIERWSGKSWYPSLCSPYKTMSEVNEHLRDYWWHYTAEYPYRIKNFKPKKKVQKYVPKYKSQDWNSDDQMVVSYSR